MLALTPPACGDGLLDHAEGRELIRSLARGMIMRRPINCIFLPLIGAECEAVQAADPHHTAYALYSFAITALSLGQMLMHMQQSYYTSYG